MIAFALLLLISASPLYADQDELAKSLFLQQKYINAANQFSDPLWQGIAFYRAGRWLDAARSFAHSDSAIARYNLANTYAQMGQYKLALESYQQIKSDSPAFSDAEKNADLMKRLLSEDDDKQTSNQPQKSGNRKQNGKKQPGNQSGGQSQNQSEESAEKSARQRQKQQAKPSSDSANKNNDPASTNKERQQQSSLNSEKATAGRQASDPLLSPQQRAEQDNFAHTPDSRNRSGNTLNKQAQERQALEQWLSTIEDRPARFLRARINQAIRQRAIAGTLAEPGEYPW